MLFSAGNVMAQEKATYEVKSGDTMYGISKSLNVTISELQQWNDLSNNEIEVGQTLVYYIREEDSEGNTDQDSESLINQPSVSENVFYTVKSGDTLYGIAREHNMTISQLRELNNITGDNIRVGQTLAVKKKNEAPPSVAEFSEESTPQGVFSIYSIRSGDTVNAINRRFKMTEEEFLHLNPDVDPNRLVAGQEVTILLPPSRNYDNPYLQKADLQDLGEVSVAKYDSSRRQETTTNGELYDPNGLTAAHSNMALGSIIFVENSKTGHGIYVRVNDRITGSGLKLSEKAFTTLQLNEVNEPAVKIYTEVND
ncbi:LysM peptidoglycan-binding domain-containing protein [Gracilimonas sp. Q87]|uniref:LysM peptidoglycan-binding domain-containing protein n=1 Tax=Gracilimonas sp. Q87 TaxID=3384766 RepID=UPI00398410F3